MNSLLRGWSRIFLKNRYRIVRKLAMAECFRTCVKSGFKVPKNIDLSYKLDEQNGNSLRRDAINKEMHHVIPAFIVFNCTSVEIKAKIELEGYQRIRCHMIFNITMDFTRQVCFDAGVMLQIN